jgi:hypothetical protein
MVLRIVTGITSIPAVRALALGGLIWLLVFAYCDQALWRNPHGAYFHSEHIYDLDYSHVRQQEARNFLKRHSGPALNSTELSSASPQHAGNDPALCAAFVTVRREHPDAALYFSDSIGTMLEGLAPHERSALNVSVLFANVADPAQHPDFNAPWLSSLIDHASGYEGLPEAEMAELRRLEEEKDFQRKGVLDYLYVLEKCYNDTQAPFIAVFEDDIVFAADWLSRTLFGLQHLTTSPPINGEPPWLYLRLFYTETFLEWDANIDWWYGHLTETFALASFTTLAGLVVIRQLLLWYSYRRNRIGGENNATTRAIWIWKSPTLGLRLDIPTILVLSFILAPAFTALVFMAGKYSLPMYSLQGAGHTIGNMIPGGPSWQKHAGVMPMDIQGCCTQALVFDRARVPDLIAHLRERGRGQTDLMIEEYCAAKPLRRFALGEQAVQHIGIMSSRGGSTVNGQSTWAFYFEQSRAEAIRRRHKKVLEKIDWDVFKALQNKGG